MSTLKRESSVTTFLPASDSCLTHQSWLERKTSLQAFFLGNGTGKAGIRATPVDFCFGWNYNVENQIAEQTYGYNQL